MFPPPALSLYTVGSQQHYPCFLSETNGCHVSCSFLFLLTSHLLLEGFCCFLLCVKNSHLISPYIKTKFKFDLIINLTLVLLIMNEYIWFDKGATFLVWFGPTVRLTVSDPDLIREIFTSKSEFYEKNEAPPLVKQLEGDGLLSLKGEKWAHHRKIISPTFHMENLKVKFILNYHHFILLLLF